jgi:hypothetical protein
MMKIIIIILLTLSLNLTAQTKNHNFTLNSSFASVGANFQSWADFLRFIDTFNLNDTVHLDVQSDFNNIGQLVFKNVKKLKDTARLIVHGHGHKLIGNISDAILVFDGASYLEIDSLFIANKCLNSSSIGIRIKNNANYNKISHCKIELASSKKKKMGFCYIAITDRDSGFSYSLVHPGSYNFIEFNQLYTDSTEGFGPGFGVLFLGVFSSSSIRTSHNTIRSNFITNVFSIGVKDWFANGDFIIGNEIKRNCFNGDSIASTYTGININYSYASYRVFRVDSNEIYETQNQYIIPSKPIDKSGLVLTSMFGSSNFPCSVSGNRIHDISTYGSVTGISYNGNWGVINDNKIFNFWQPSVNDLSIGFTGIAVGMGQGNMLVEGNEISQCNGSWSWKGISITGGDIKNSKIVRNNIIKNNVLTSNSFIGILFHSMKGSDAKFPVIVSGNKISENNSYNAIFTGVSVSFDGYFQIEDNLIEKNKSNIGLYGLFLRFSNSAKILRNRIIDNTADSAKFASVYPIYHREALYSFIASNLITGNTSNNTIYGIYLTSDAGKEVLFKVLQNTIQIDLLDADKLSRHAQLLNIELANAGFELTGNMIDAKYTHKSTEFLQVSTSSVISRNSYCHRFSDQSSFWCLAGTFYSDLLFANTMKNGNVAAPIGLFLNADYSSAWYYNQDNVPTDSDNKLDVYGNMRNLIYSDRGAVEYNGIVGIESKSIQETSYVYPNPSDGRSLKIYNAFNSTSFELLDLQGIVVHLGLLNNGLNDIELGAVNSGVYLLRLNNELKLIKLVVYN